MSSEQYRNWYQDAYHQNVYTHDYLQDLNVGRQRIRAYQTRYKAPALDIGAANGGFLDAAHEAGFDVIGQEIAQNGRADTHIGEFESLRFSPDYFCTVTMHDVLEHIADVAPFLREVYRIIKPGGRIIVDFPKFWAPEGRHHWKPVQHLWFFTESQLIGVLQDAGFEFESIEYPVPSKVVVYATKNGLTVRPAAPSAAGKKRRHESFSPKNVYC